jgi:hypothetical protein
VQDLKRFFRANPQVLVLVLVCLILGVGTFFIVIFGLATSGQHSQVSGEPSGVLALARGFI